MDRESHGFIVCLYFGLLLLSLKAQAQVIINEVDADSPGSDKMEFIELYDGGIGFTDLGGMVIVFFNGSDNASYHAIDLDGYSTNAEGYFLIGNPGIPGIDISFGNGSLQNGADAVALYFGSSSDFSNDTPISTVFLIDAVVYGTGQSDDLELIALLNPGQSQVNEDFNDSSLESSQRCPNGDGGPRNTSTYIQTFPTPGAVNSCASSVFVIINEVDAVTLGPDDMEFVELFDGGVGNTSLDGLVLVAYDGNDNSSYNLGGHPNGIDLDGFTTDDDGYFVLGNSSVNGVDLTFGNGSLQNGSDAVALYAANGVDFPDNTMLTLTNIVDALVYDTGQANDPDLLDLLNVSQNQVNENTIDATLESNQRCPNGDGGKRNTSSYYQTVPTSGSINICTSAYNVIINEVDADNLGTDDMEFIELYDGGVGFTPLDGLVLVTFNGNDDQSYNLGGHSNAIDLDGMTTDAYGYFVVGNLAVSGVDLTFANNSLQNGADAVALFVGNGIDFPNDTPISIVNLVDALVYNTGQVDDPDLMVLLNTDQEQINEDLVDSGIHSNQRCPNGSGGERNTLNFLQNIPTPDMDNACMCSDAPDLAFAHSHLNSCGLITVDIELSIENGPGTLTHNGNGELSIYELNDGFHSICYAPDISDLGSIVTIKGTIPDPDEGPLCQVSSDSISISFYPNPMVLATADSPICENEDAVFYLTGDNGTEIAYEVNGEEQQMIVISGGIGSVEVANVSEDVTLTLLEINDPSTGCSLNLPASTTVTVNSLPATPEIDDIYVCEGQSTEIDPTGGAFADVENVVMTWDFEEESISGISSNIGKVSAEDVSRGAGLGDAGFPSGCNSLNAFSSNRWTGLSEEYAIDAGDYVEFCVVAIDGFDIELNQLVFHGDRSPSGPLAWAVYADGLKLGSGATTDVCSNHEVDGFHLVVSQLDNVCLRIYAWGASSNSGTWRIDDIMLSGKVYPAGAAMCRYNYYNSDLQGDDAILLSGPTLNPYDPLTLPGFSDEIFITKIDQDGCESLSEKVAVTVPVCFDLALTKEVNYDQSGSGPFKPGSIVTFTIVAYNQGTIPAYEVEIGDIVPPELVFDPTLNDERWNGEYGDNYPKYCIEMIKPGDSDSTEIILIIESGINSESLINSAEISFATAIDGSTENAVDQDSAPADNSSSDPEIASDGDIDDESDGSPGESDNPLDDDDFDPAEILICLTDAGMIIDSSSNISVCEGEFMGPFTTAYSSEDVRDPNESCILSRLILSEIRIDQEGADLDEFIELCGPPGFSLNDLSLIIIGDGINGSGTIEEKIDLSDWSLSDSGYFVIAESSFSLGEPDLAVSINAENSDNVTFLIVENFTGVEGSDIDLNDDGIIDQLFWTSVIDGVALIEEVNPPAGTEYEYASYLGFPAVGPDGNEVPEYILFDVCNDLWEIGAGDEIGIQETPGKRNYILQYIYLWLVENMNTTEIILIEEGFIESNYSVNIADLPVGEYCVFGFSFEGTTEEFLAYNFQSVQEIEEAILKAVICGDLSSDSCITIIVHSIPEPAQNPENQVFCENEEVPLLKVGDPEEGFFITWWTEPFEGEQVKYALIGGAKFNEITLTAESIPPAPEPGQSLTIYAEVEGAGACVSGSRVPVTLKHRLLPFSPVLKDIVICDGGDTEIFPIQDQADLIFRENFEGPEFSYVTSEPEFTDGDKDFFIRTDGSDISGSYHVEGVEGIYFFAAQDVDGQGGPKARSIFMTGIPIDNKKDLKAIISLAEDDDGSNEDWDDTATDDNFVHFDYQIDGNGYMNLIHVESDLSGTVNGTPRIDTDFDGIGDGTEITDEFMDFSAAIPGNGNILDLRISIILEDGEEDIALDNIRIMGVQECQYFFYDADPALGGTLLAGPALSYDPMVTPEDSPKRFWVTCFDSYCESEAESIDLKVQNGPSLTCESIVHVNMGEECEFLVGADLLADNFNIWLYEISLTNENGTPVSNPITEEELGKTLKYELINSCDGNSCWGLITVEDKTPPFVEICPCAYGEVDGSNPACTFNCIEEVDLPDPVFSDNCCIVNTDFHDELVAELDCQVKEYKRIWSHIPSGRESGFLKDSIELCVQSYFILPPELEVVVFPTQNIVLECNGSNEETKPDYIEKVFDDPGTGQFNEGIAYAWPHLLLTNGEIVKIGTIDKKCNLVVVKSDQPLDAECPILKKIVRFWSILNWCDGALITQNQIIEIKDSRPPTINHLPGDQTISIDPWTCTANLVIPDSEYGIKPIDECSEINLYATLDNQLTPYKIGETLTGLVEGIHTLLYHAIDLCGNENNAAIQIKVIDNSPPVPVCKDKLVVSLSYNDIDLSIDGTVIINAAELDRGSHDAGCGPIFFKIIRSDELYGSSNGYWNNLGLDRKPDFTLPPRQLFFPAPLCRAANGDDFGNVIRFDSKGKLEVIPTFQQFFFDDYAEFCCDDLNKELSLVMRVYDKDPGPGPVDPRRMEDRDYGGIPGFDEISNDLFGHFNDCIVRVDLQLKTPPGINCPADFTVNCLDDVHPELTGYAVAQTLCSDHVVTWEDSFYGDGVCGFDYISREWFINEEPASCQQIIHIDELIPFDPLSIKWPPHRTGDYVCGLTLECQTNEDQEYSIEENKDCFYLPKALECQQREFCSPEWDESGCGLIGLSLKSNTVFQKGEACRIVINHWTIIDWCTWNPNTGQDIGLEQVFNMKDFEGYKWIQDRTFETCSKESCFENEFNVYARYREDAFFENQAVPGIYRWEQVIKIIDSSVPVIVDCDRKEIGIYDLDCKAELVISNTAIDSGDCATSQLSWDIEVYDQDWNLIDRFELESKNGEEVSINLGQDDGLDPDDLAGGRLEKGMYRVIWGVRDGCGNYSSSTQIYNIEDKKPPTPICHTSISSSLIEPSGQLELWATDFNQKSEDNCTNTLGLIYNIKISGDSTDPAPSIILECDELINNPVQLELWISDEAGNSDWCEVYLFVKDPEGICQSPSSAGVSGHVYTEQGDMIDNVSMEFTKLSKGNTKSMITRADGFYHFSDNKINDHYSLIPRREDSILNGVSTLDIVLIQKHILQLDKLDSPYKIIAADITNDWDVSAVDLVELRKVILGKIDHFPNNESWRFVDGLESFPEIYQPFPFDEIIMITPLEKDMINVDFLGIKIGDVSGNALANAWMKTEMRTKEKIIFETKDNFLYQGEYTAVDFSCENCQEVVGFQFTLEHPGIQYANIVGDAIDINESNISITNERIAMSWNQLEVLGDGNDLFTIYFVAKQKVRLSEILNIGSNLIPAEAYVGRSLRQYDVKLEVKSDIRTEELKLPVLFQNEPNPFGDETQIAFWLPRPGMVKIKVLNLSAQSILNIHGEFVEGIQAVTITEVDLPVSGVYYYQLEYEGNIFTKRLVHIK